MKLKIPASFEYYTFHVVIVLESFEDSYNCFSWICNQGLDAINIYIFGSRNMKVWIISERNLLNMCFAEKGLAGKPAKRLKK